MLQCGIRRVLEQGGFGDRISSTKSKGLPADLDTWCRLLPFVFIALYHIEYVFNKFGRVSHFDDLGECFFLLKISFKYCVKKIVGGKGIRILLIMPEFSGGGLCYNALWDDLNRPVDVASHLVNFTFIEITDNRKPAGHVPVKGAVSCGQLRFIAGGKNEMAESVRKGHKDVAPYPRLNVLFGCVTGKTIKA